jgi:hypothetical protein
MYQSNPGLFTVRGEEVQGGTEWGLGNFIERKENQSEIEIKRKQKRDRQKSTYLVTEKQKANVHICITVY